MVEAVRQGRSQREVARAFRVALFTLQWWLKRAEGRALEHVQWANRSRAPARVHHRTGLAIELAVLECRQRLHATSVLGFYGAQAIHETLRAEATLLHLPSVRTIGRILQRHGALDRRRRLRHPAPPPGWYLPAVRAKQAELEAFDVIEGLVIEGRGDVKVLTGKALWGPTAGVWPVPAVTAKTALEVLLPHWQAHGLPQFVQFDNDTRFQGGHNHPDVLGRVVRVSLSLGITPVFVPPRERGVQAVIDNFNGLGPSKVWSRFHHIDLTMLQSRSTQFLAASLRWLAQRTDQGPPRHPFPQEWHLNLQAAVRGRVIYLRRTDANGAVSLLGHCFPVDPLWTHRLVRCEVEVGQHHIAFYRLRRRDPEQQPLIKTIEYRFPRRPFLESEQEVLTLGPSRLNQRGVTYLVVMCAIALMGVAMTAVGKQWSVEMKRDREAELAFRGNRIKAALEAYAADYEVMKATRPNRYPVNLEQLTQMPKRYLPRVYKDPITGQDFELIKVGAEIRGVRSRSKGVPLGQVRFKKAATYHEVLFQAMPPSDGQACGPGTVAVNPLNPLAGCVPAGQAMPEAGPQSQAGQAAPHPQALP